MKKTLTIFSIIICTAAFSQNYSTFYGTYDVNQNVNIKKDVNVSGTVNQNVNKTVTTIDYGALAAANAQKEANRLDAMQYTDSRDAIRAQEIAADPFAAYRYGAKFDQLLSRSTSRKYLKSYGHGGKKCRWNFTEPSELLFSKTAFGHYRNTSADGLVLCEIQIDGAYNYSYASSQIPEAYPPSISSAREFVDELMSKNIVGEVRVRGDEDCFTHKSELNRATVYGHKGYIYTWVYETEFEFVICDSYVSMNNGILYYCRINYTVDKTRGSFEDLEGRRFYLKRLGEELVATANFFYL